MSKDDIGDLSSPDDSPGLDRSAINRDAKRKKLEQKNLEGGFEHIMKAYTGRMWLHRFMVSLGMDRAPTLPKTEHEGELIALLSIERERDRIIRELRGAIEALAPDEGVAMMKEAIERHSERKKAEEGMRQTEGEEE